MRPAATRKLIALQLEATRISGSRRPPRTMEYGVHLPLIDFGTSPSLRGLKEYARAAAGLDYRFLCANDHLLFARPWLDGPTALAAVIEESRDVALATTIGLPVIRGPVQLAKTLAAIDVLSRVAWSSESALVRRPPITPLSASPSTRGAGASRRH